MADRLRFDLLSEAIKADLSASRAHPAVQSLESRLMFSSYTLSTIATFSTAVDTPAAPLTFSNVVFDSEGDAFGLDGSNGIYEVAKGSSTGAQIATLPTGTTGSLNTLSIDGQGNIYGLADVPDSTDSSFSDTVLYELPHGASTVQTIVNFGESQFISDGDSDGGELLIDSKGDVFGTDRNGGANAAGYIWEVAAGSDTLTTLASFAKLNPDGLGHTSPSPNLTLTEDSAGDLFGTTNGGGNSIGTGDGTIFELPAGSSTIQTLASFSQGTGIYPQSGVVMDGSGDLFGCVLDITDGASPGIGETGSIFELASRASTPTTVAAFTAATGYSTSYPLVIDSGGDIFGSSQYGGDITSSNTEGVGADFELPAGSGTIEAIHTFGSDNLATPGPLTLNASTGFLYGIVDASGTDPDQLYSLSTGGSGGGGGGGTGGTTGTLTPTISKSTLPPSVVAGGTSRGTISVSLLNSASTPFKANAETQIFASSDGSVDSASTLLGSFTGIVSAKAGSTAKVTVQIKSVPATLDGTYTLFAETTDSAGSATSAAGPTLKAAAPFVAFTSESLTTNLTGSVVSGSKTKDSATISLTNTGNLPSTGSTVIKLLISPNGTLASGTEIRSVTQLVVVEPDKSKTIKIPLETLPDVPDGTYQLVAEITDPKSDVTTVASTATALLSAAFVKLVPSTPVITDAAKGAATVSFIITNNGNIVPAGKTTIALLGSATTTAADSATLFSESLPLPLQPSKSKSFKIKLTATELSQVTAAGNLVVQITDPLGGIETASTTG